MYILQWWGHTNLLITAWCDGTLFLPRVTSFQNRNKWPRICHTRRTLHIFTHMGHRQMRGENWFHWFILGIKIDCSVFCGRLSVSQTESTSSSDQSLPVKEVLNGVMVNFSSRASRSLKTLAQWVSCNAQSGWALSGKAVHSFSKILDKPSSSSINPTCTAALRTRFNS